MGPGINNRTRRASKASTVWQRFFLPMVGVLVAACAATIFSLAFEARQRFLEIDFGLAETLEHELGRLESGLATLSVTMAQQETATPDSLRQGLSTISAQVQVIEDVAIRARLVWEPPYAAGLTVLLGKLDALTATATRDDGDLRIEMPGIVASLPQLVAMAGDLSDRARRDQEQQTAESRKIVSASLLRLVVLTGGLVLVLAAGSVQLLRLHLRTREQTDAARRSRARLEAIFRVSADAIIVTDWTGRVIDFNRATLAVSGLSADRFPGACAADLLFPPALRDAQKEHITRALQSTDPRVDGPLLLELEAMRADGTCFPVEVSLATARVEGDNIIVALMRDISIRRRTERELTEARDRALAGEQAKADFLAIMSHEMRTPLNGLVGSVDLLAQTPLDMRQRELVSVLGASAEILLDHVNAGLDIARSEARPSEAAMVEFDLERLIEDCMANQAGLAASGGNRLESRSLSGPVGLLRGEPARVRQVLLNLLGNAVKFTRGGRIAVETEVACPWVEIRVIDSGIGIAPEHQQRIFEDFVTLDAGYDRHSGGTGLGLGIARRLARIMGGEITVTSAPGSGSRFTLRLPLRRGGRGLAAPSDTGQAPAPATPPRLVLLIEDNDINRFIAQNFLESAGHRVVTARNGTEGLEAAGQQCFDVVLTDISMPGLDGLQVARRIRDGGGPSAGSRILALTAHSLAADAEALARAGIDDCLQKPIGRAALLGALEARPAPGLSVAAGTAPIDTGQLRELESQIGTAALTALIRQMILDGDAIMGRIRALGPEPSPEAGRRLVHQMAGAVSTFGTGPLYQRLAELLEALRAGIPAEDQFALLPDLWQTTRTALADEMRARDLPDGDTREFNH